MNAEEYMSNYMKSLEEHTNHVKSTDFGSNYARKEQALAHCESLTLRAIEIQTSLRIANSFERIDAWFRR